MKNLKNVQGAKALTVKAQKEVNGGRRGCRSQSDCWGGTYCCSGTCQLPLSSGHSTAELCVGWISDL